MAEKTKKSHGSNVLIAAIVIIFLVVIIGFVSIDGILKYAIKTAVKQQLNVDASAAMVSLSIFSGNVTISNLKIGNPPGYQYKNVLEANSISVTTSISSLLSNPVEINDITIDGVTMVIEQKGMTNNLSDILKSMPKPQQTETKTAEPAKKGKSVHISTVDMKNIGVTAKLLPIPGKSDALTLRIASIHLSNLGGEKSSLGDVVGKIFAAISAEIAAKGAGILPSDLTGSIQNAGKSFESATESIKGLFKPTDKPAGSSTDQGTQDAASKLKGLFEKKK
ncbi:MAG: hypothetical protein ABR969_01320 [Sedimentisphaerales bacterium]